MDYSRIDPETVAWAYERASALLELELGRSQSLTERAVQLAGFAGIVLAMVGGLAQDGFTVELGPLGERLFAWCYLVAASLLGVTILWVLALVYRPVTKPWSTHTTSSAT
jgi:hypothetical protein